MDYFKIKIKSSSPFLSPWQVDTIFGHLCWAVIREQGEEGFKEFIKPFLEGDPPFLISNGFPKDLLPIPLSAFQLLPEKEEKLKKKLKKISFVDQKTFEEIINAQTWEPSENKAPENPFSYFTTAHASISRLTNTTSEGGQFFEQEEYILKEDYLTIYLKAKPGWDQLIDKLFKIIAQTGYGAKKSIGKGNIQYLGIEKFNLPKIENPNGFVSISNFVPASNDPTKGLYKILVKYGKLGEELARSGNPFKKPLIMLEAGACFENNNGPKEFYGKMITDMDYINLGVVQYAFAFPIPIKMPEINT